MIVGLTGKSCSGKDTFASLLDDRFVVIDVDKLGHAALERNAAALKDAFGEEIFASGVVDRKKLGPIVFSDKNKLALLNSIVHPWMVEETVKKAHEIEKTGKIAVINAAILEEMGFVKYCNEIVLVISPYEMRYKRAEERDHISEENFRKRSSSQAGIGVGLYSSGKKVITIINDKGMEEFSRQVNAYCASIK